MNRLKRLAIWIQVITLSVVFALGQVFFIDLAVKHNVNYGIICGSSVGSIYMFGELFGRYMENKLKKITKEGRK